MLQLVTFPANLISAAEHLVILVFALAVPAISLWALLHILCMSPFERHELSEDVSEYVPGDWN